MGGILLRTSRGGGLGFDGFEKVREFVDDSTSVRPGIVHISEFGGRTVRELLIEVVGIIFVVDNLNERELESLLELAELAMYFDPIEDI